MNAQLAGCSAPASHLQNRTATKEYKAEGAQLNASHCKGFLSAALR